MIRFPKRPSSGGADASSPVAQETAANDEWPPIVMEVVTDPVRIAQARVEFAQFKRNNDWLEAHASEVYSHRGRYICIAGQELFVGDSVEDVLTRAKAAHPEDKGFFLSHIPKDRGRPRIYAYRGIVETL